MLLKPCALAISLGWYFISFFLCTLVLESRYSWKRVLGRIPPRTEQFSFPPADPMNPSVFQWEHAQVRASLFIGFFIWLSIAVMCCLNFCGQKLMSHFMRLAIHYTFTKQYLAFWKNGNLVWTQYSKWNSRKDGSVGWNSRRSGTDALISVEKYSPIFPLPPQ